jgi:hypothetical protein
VADDIRVPHVLVRREPDRHAPNLTASESSPAPGPENRERRNPEKFYARARALS